MAASCLRATLCMRPFTAQQHVNIIGSEHAQFAGLFYDWCHPTPQSTFEAEQLSRDLGAAALGNLPLLSSRMAASAVGIALLGLLVALLAWGVKVAFSVRSRRFASNVVAPGESIASTEEEKNPQECARGPVAEQLHVPVQLL